VTLRRHITRARFTTRAMLNDPAHSATAKIEFLAFALAKLSSDRAVSYELSHYAELIANGAVVVLDEGRPRRRCRHFLTVATETFRILATSRVVNRRSIGGTGDVIGCGEGVVAKRGVGLFVLLGVMGFWQFLFTS
jgi:hypothetical protein